MDSNCQSSESLERLCSLKLTASTSSPSASATTALAIATATVAAASVVNDESTKSPVENRNLKHFKKSMIVEYESGINDDSHSSTSSSHSSSMSHSSNTSVSSSSSMSSNTDQSFKQQASSSNSKMQHDSSGSKIFSSELKSSAGKKSKNISSSSSSSSSSSLNRATSSSNKKDKTEQRKKAKYDDLYENEKSFDEEDADYNEEDSVDFEEDEHEESFHERYHKSSESSRSDTSETNSSDEAKNALKKKKIAELAVTSSKISSIISDNSNNNNNNNKPKSTSDLKKDSNSSKKKTYCICKSTDSQRFMIACDNCDDWYHGDCVGVSQSLSKKIRAFYCHICRKKKSSLSIKYKSKFQDFLKLYSKPTTNRSKLLNSDESFVKFLKETKIREKKESELNRKSTDHNESATKSSIHHHTKTTITTALSSSKVKTTKPETSKQNSSQSTEAASATTKPTSLNTASNANSMFNFDNSPNRVYGKSNISGEDFENFFSAITKLGHDAAQLAAAKAAENNSTFTQNESLFDNNCSNANDGSKSRATNSETDDNEATNQIFNDEGNSNSNEKSMYEEDSDFEEKLKSKDTSSSTKPSNKANKVLSSKTNKNSKSNKKTNIKRLSTKGMKQPHQRRRHLTSSASKPTNEENEEAIQFIAKKPKIREPMQCLGPECVNEAMPESKYCSTECGMKLAKNRLVHFLKARIEQYNESPCYSNILNQTELEKINSEIESLKLKLNDLEQKHLDLDRIIERAKFKKINPSIEKERDRNLESNEIEVYCVTCGNLCTERIALKHMEKCFNKVESQAFFGSYFKTRIDGQSMFCDYYNPQTKMYCKRLKVICPEHEKEKKVNDDEVCGCPLPKLTNVLEDSENDICLASKRTCSLHFKWEKMRRAHIDLEKLRTWLKLEELMEHKRMNETSLNQRAGLLSLLLHQTSSNLNNNSNIAAATGETALQNNENS